MRTILLAVLSSVVAIASAEACPRSVVCIVTEPHDLGLANAPTEHPRTVKATDLAVVLRLGGRTTQAKAPALAPPWHAAPHARGPEVPWIWVALRSAVYQRLPRYDGEQGFSLVLSPVVVKGSFDTVPGVGLAGDF